MNKDAQWWKEYRLKNGDKLKAYKRARYHAKKGPRIAQDTSKPPAPSLVEVPMPNPPNPITCCLCTSKGVHKGFYQGALSLFCSKHWKV